MLEISGKKSDKISNYLRSLDVNLSIIGLTKTWLTDNCANLYNISGYKLLTKNRKNKSGGGIGMYVAEQISFS